MSNRSAQLPGNAFLLDYVVSKADLLEIAWHLASRCNEAGSADDNESTLLCLLDEAQVIADGQGRRVGNLRAKYEKFERDLVARRAARSSEGRS